MDAAITGVFAPGLETLAAQALFPLESRAEMRGEAGENELADIANIGMPQFGPGNGNGIGLDDDFGRENTSGNAADRYEFRTPSLLNVELTGPYGHAGQFSTLRSMVRHYQNATASLNNYDIMDHVTDTSLVGTQVANQIDVLAVLDGAVSNPIDFDVDLVTSFMTALTATSALDLSGLVPTSVPSGLTLDL